MSNLENISRREFLNLSAAIAGGIIIGGGCKPKKKPIFFPYESQVKVYDIYQIPETIVEGVDVTLGAETVQTDINGIARFQIFSEGLQDLTIAKPGNHTYNFQADITRSLPNISEFIIPVNSDLDNHYTSLFLSYGALQKPNFDLMNIYIDTTNAPGQPEIDQAIAIYENDLPVLTNGRFTATQSNGRIQVGTSPPVTGTDNWFKLRWDILGAGHSEYLNGIPNLITAASSVVSPTSPIDVYKEEIAQPLGARNDSDYPNTIFEATIPSGLTDWSQEDRDCFLRAMRRPIGSYNS